MPEGFSFAELLETFESVHLPTIASGTRRRYLVDLDFRIKPYFQKREDVREITSLDLHRFRASILKKISRKSVNNCTDLLGLIFRKAVEWEMLEKSPKNFKRLKLAETKYLWWDKRESIVTFLEHAKMSRYYPAYKLALECGLRIGEIVGLGKSDVNLERCQIHIHQQWLEREKELAPTKNWCQRFLNFDKQSDLRETLAESIAKSPHPQAIFVDETGDRVHPKQIRVNDYNTWLESSLVPRIRFHDLRHTFASWYMLEHDNIWNLKKILGQKDIQTTQRYAHLSKKHQVVESLNWSSFENQVGGDP